MRTNVIRSDAGRLLVSLVAAACLVVAVPTAAVAAGARTKPPSKVPSLPQEVTVTPGPGQLTVSWLPPAYDGEFLNHLGQPVAYVITDYDLKGVPKASWATCVDLDLTCTVTGLKPGHTYEVAVRVYNAKGKHSHYTTAVPGTPT